MTAAGAVDEVLEDGLEEVVAVSHAQKMDSVVIGEAKRQSRQEIVGNFSWREEAVS